MPLPVKIQKIKAVLSIKNNDQTLHPVCCNDRPQRVSNYVQYQHELKTEALDFPTPLSQIPEFEKRNKISVNVFGLGVTKCTLYK